MLIGGSRRLPVSPGKVGGEQIEWRIDVSINEIVHLKFVGSLTLLDEPRISGRFVRTDDCLISAAICCGPNGRQAKTVRGIRSIQR